MEKIIHPFAIFLFIIVFISLSQSVAVGKGSFDDNFSKSCPETHFKTSEDGQIWYLSLDKQAGCGFTTKQRYRFGWFSMKLKLVGGDSAGVVTAYYMCSENGAGPERDELDIEFLGNRTGQPYLIQTNIYKNGTGNREMRHMLWFDPTEEFHTYSILWNNHQIVFFVDKVPIRVYKNANYTNNFFPNEKPMYLFSSIWNADDWATRGGIEKTDWKKAPFVSSYKEFNVDGCQWEEPYPACVSTTTKNWWDQYNAWHLSDDQKKDFSWVERNLVIYDYCKDTQRFPTLPQESNGDGAVVTGAVNRRRRLRMLGYAAGSWSWFCSGWKLGRGVIYQSKTNCGQEKKNLAGDGELFLDFFSSKQTFSFLDFFNSSCCAWPWSEECTGGGVRWRLRSVRLERVPATRVHPSIYNPPGQGASDTGGEFRLWNFSLNKEKCVMLVQIT
ncbi:Xyloglucan endotransglucosylase/hydrolase [Forsythia ovata]|uniref:xyloglucan:xyloglucosyl transferase n=1 Tax=Forsythia ovata TaxID=205694 RepID=A0ABD1QBB6_9LAMI